MQIVNFTAIELLMTFRFNERPNISWSGSNIGSYISIEWNTNLPVRQAI